MGTLLAVLMICGMTGTLVSLTRRRFGECLPVALLSMPLALYFSQFLFGSFQPGFVALIVIAAAVPLVALRGLPNFRKHFFTVGLFTFLAIALAAILLDYHREFYEWDEFSHWGMMVKELFRLDQWYSIPASRLMRHPDYPPYMALFELLWCKASGGYAERYTYTALHVFTLCLVTPNLAERMTEATENAPNAWLKKGIVALMGCFLVIASIKWFDVRSRFNSLHKDIVTSMIAAYGVFVVYNGISDADRSIPWDSIKLILCGTALLMTKQAGLAFALLVWIYFTMSHMRLSKRPRALPDTAKAALRLALIVGVPLAISGLWKSYVKSLGLSGQFDLGLITWNDLADVFRSPYVASVRRITLASFIHALFERNLANSFLPVTYAGSLPTAVALILLMRFFHREAFSRKRAVHLSVLFLCGTAGYALMMGVLYLFCFSTHEMLRLASFERYMSSYVLFEALTLTAVELKLLSSAGRIRPERLAVCCAACLLLTNSTGIRFLVLPGIDGVTQRESRDLARKLDEYVDTDARLFIVSEEYLEDVLKFNYYSTKARPVLPSSDSLNERLYIRVVRESIAGKIFGCDYVYFQAVNNNFNSAYAEEYNQGLPFLRGILYQVHRDEEAVTLEPVHALPFETDFMAYWSWLEDERYTAFIAVKDEASTGMTEEMWRQLHEAGLACEFGYRDSYYAMMDRGTVTEVSDATELSLEGEFGSGHTFSIYSAGRDVGDKASIVIDDVEYSLNKRGMNIVVFDNELDMVVDSVTFDTFGAAEASR